MNIQKYRDRRKKELTYKYIHTHGYHGLYTPYHIIRPPTNQLFYHADHSHGLMDNFEVIILPFLYVLPYANPAHQSFSLQWRHNEHDGISNHQTHDCLLNRLFKRRSKKISKLCVTGLGAGNSPVTGEFPAQRVSNTENVSIWWRHHVHHLMVGQNDFLWQESNYDFQLGKDQCLAIYLWHLRMCCNMCALITYSLH